MINTIWLFFLTLGVLYAALQGQIEIVTYAAIKAAEDAVTLSFKLIGVMSLWLGILKIAEKSGLVKAISYILNPFIRFLFPSIPKNHPALGAIALTISANILGLGNAVTPLGIKAMEELQKLNTRKDTASPAMITLMALCTTGFTLIPATIIALRSAAGAQQPEDIITAVIITSFIAMIITLIVDRICQRKFK